MTIKPAGWLRSPINKNPRQESRCSVADINGCYTGFVVIVLSYCGHQFVILRDVAASAMPPTHEASGSPAFYKADLAVRRDRISMSLTH